MKNRTTKGATEQHIANAIDHLADRLEQGDRSIAIQKPLMEVMTQLARRRNVAGLQLLNRVGFLLLTSGQPPSRFAPVRRMAASQRPLNTGDVKALRQLATEIRTQKASESGTTTKSSKGE
jgi:hypothetical protein